MPGIDIRVEHGGDSADTSTIQAVRSEEMREFDKEDVASLFALRSDVNTLSLEVNEDYIYLVQDGSDLFGGVLRDITRGDGVTELLVESFERLARDGPHTRGGEVWENVDDSDIISDAISEISELSEGDVHTVGSGLTFVFSHVSQARKMRTVDENTTGFTRFNPDKTVDYKHVDDYGSDRQTTLSPSAQNVVDQFVPERDSGDEEVTHLRMLGAGEGEGQTQALIVPEDDPIDYEGQEPSHVVVRRYEGVWSPGDRRKRGVRSNKDVTDAETLAHQGEVKVLELQQDHLSVETTIEGVDVNLGDRFKVEHSREQIDETLRVVKHTRVIDAEGTHHHVVLSNRAQTLETDDEKEIKDVERYNMAFEGTNVQLGDSEGWAAVSPDVPYEAAFYYPDEVKHESRLELLVQGRPYRTYSSGAASGGGEHFHEVELDFTHGHDTQGHSHPIDDVTNANTEQAIVDQRQQHLEFDYDEGENLIDSFTPSNPTSAVVCYFGVRWTSEESTRIDFRVTDGVEDWPHGSDPRAIGRNQQPDEWVPVLGTFTAYGDFQNTELEFRGNVTTETDPGDMPLNMPTAVVWNAVGTHEHIMDATTESAAEVVETEILETVETTEDAVGLHTHPPDPGLQLFPNEIPEDCTVRVNGNIVAENIGDGSSFAERVNVLGEIPQGDFFDVEVESENLGELNVTFAGDVYRQILGDG